MSTAEYGIDIDGADVDGDEEDKPDDDNVDADDYVDADDGAQSDHIYKLHDLGSMKSVMCQSTIQLACSEQRPSFMIRAQGALSPAASPSASPL